jgi:hypothetical protein
MDITICTMAWGDSNGLDWAFGWDVVTSDALGTGADGMGYIGVNGFNINSLHIRARTEATDTYGSYSLSSHAIGVNHLKPITIDVATGTASLPLNGVGVTFVRIGFGSLQISMQDMDFYVALGSNVATTGLDQRLGEVYISGLNLYINSGSYVDIYKQASKSCGVTFDLNFTIDHIDLTAVSWGDTDGALNSIANGQAYDWMTTAGAGYIGLNNIKMGAITITGAVSIDVNTATAGEYIAAAQYLFDFTGGVGTWMDNNGAGTAKTLVRPTSVTVVHITFGEGTTPFNINVAGPITADVKLSSAKALATVPQGNTKTLGDIYLSGFNCAIQAGSWVDIWAH